MKTSKKESFDKIIEKIDKYLNKRSYTNYASIKLLSYNNNDIYIRFDYVNKLKAYKITWFDLKYLDLKNIEYYMNSCLVTSFLANKMVNFLYQMKLENGIFIDPTIIGDRVIFTNRANDDVKTYTFDRYLPLKWNDLIDPLSLMFTHLPRSMETILNEIFGKFDKTEEFYNSRAPILIDFNNLCEEVLFRKDVIGKGKKLENRVTFLEKIDNKYVAVVETNKFILVVVEHIVDNFYRLYSSMNKPYLDEAMYAVLKAIINKKFNNFYKVKYKNKKNRNLLDEVKQGEFFCSFGVDNENLLLISNNVQMVEVPFLENGELVFEVIEDDDNLSLSKILNKYK